MITETIKILQSNEFFNGGDYIEFAKGSRKKPKTFKEALYKCKRIWQSRKK